MEHNNLHPIFENILNQHFHMPIMTNTEFFTRMPASCADIDLLVDGNKIMLPIFMYNNLIADDVDHISIEDAQRVIDLEIGQSIFINLTEVKRIA